MRLVRKSNDPIEPMFDLKFVERLLRNFGSLIKSFHAMDFHNNDRFLSLINQYCGGTLKRLRLNQFKIKGDLISSLHPLFVGLEVLEMERCDTDECLWNLFSTCTDASKRLPQLTQLNVTNITGISIVDIKNMLPFARNLQALNLNSTEREAAEEFGIIDDETLITISKMVENRSNSTRLIISIQSCKEHVVLSNNLTNEHHHWLQIKEIVEDEEVDAELQSYLNTFHDLQMHCLRHRLLCDLLITKTDDASDSKQNEKKQDILKHKVEKFMV